MYSNPTKAYYKSGNGSGNGGLSIYANQFIAEAKVLLNYYNSNNINLFNLEYSTNFAELKAKSFNYKNDPVANIISLLLDCINTLIIITTDLRNQVTTLENTLLIECQETTNIVITSGSVSQNANLKKLYIQYMLLFNLSATDGIFIPSYLDEAQRVLDENGQNITLPNNNL
jgi:hypothetical protein